ncbi:MAG: hypothetical protein K8R44_03625 [Sulfurimonas sp.]|nr:hypothetical protein [Sulfurimonas sp.]
MRTLFTLFPILSAVLILLSGCSATQINYNKSSIERNLNKNINKIQKLSIVVNDKSPKNIIKKLNELSISAVTYNLHASEINSNVSREFFNQYFKNITTEDINALFTVNTSLSDFTIYNSLVPGNQIVTLTLNIEVIKAGKVILKKIYKKEASGMTIVELNLTATETTFKKLHKGLLKVYEVDFKKDLLKALADNKSKGKS